MLIIRALLILAGGFALVCALGAIAACMLSSQISREEESRSPPKRTDDE